jgi:DNA-binding transcriptional LysR family regulator
MTGGPAGTKKLLTRGRIPGSPEALVDLPLAATSGGLALWREWALRVRLKHEERLLGRVQVVDDYRAVLAAGQRGDALILTAQRVGSRPSEAHAADSTLVNAVRSDALMRCTVWALCLESSLVNPDVLSVMKWLRDSASVPPRLAIGANPS